MSDEKKPTQGMPEDGLKGAPDGVNEQARYGEGNRGDPLADREDTDSTREQGPKKRKKAGFGDFMGHGGSSAMGYHGPEQLGDQDVEPDGNQNAGAKSD